MLAELQEVGPTYERKRYIGSSDIAGILGISPWKNRMQVWQSKTDDEPKPEPSVSKKKIFNRGKVWESVVCEMLVAELESNDHRVKVINTNNRYIDPAMTFCAAEIDVEILLDDIPDVVNVELKTVSPFAARHWGESMTDEVPVWYAAQGMFGLGVTGRKCCILAPLFGADEIRVYPIVRDEDTIAGMKQQARDFWLNHVLTKVAPEPLNVADIDAIFKTSADTDVIAEPYVVDLLMEYRAAAAQWDASNEQIALLEYKIKKFMGEASRLMLPGQDKAAATWKTQKATRLNIDAFKTAYPKLFKEFSKESSSRPFKVNKFQLGG